MLTEAKVESVKEAKLLINAVKTHPRAHTVFCIEIEGKAKDFAKGKLAIVNLALPEHDEAKINRRRIEESKFISGSLSALGNVVTCLNVKKHVSYRSSKFTRALQVLVYAINVRNILKETHLFPFLLG
eukprot:TRINITY_DN15435_c0_g3_i4.p1 TRINITY_DN15435_c0_g3~~TRINITY_DN15435_c0_g3_i4.p1  ORF type:complete len:128 (+),score=8.36 TRINITY_DN15435_c0_g3_i4:298-681(+)